MSLSLGPAVDRLLDRLYAQHSAQDDSLAVRDSLRFALDPSGERAAAPIVIATENEPEKARQARHHFAEAGLSDFIDLREGDLRASLVDVPGPIDFVLIDIWTPMAQPALALVHPHLREARSSSATTRPSFARPTATTSSSSTTRATGFGP